MVNLWTSANFGQPQPGWPLIEFDLLGAGQACESPSWVRMLGGSLGRVDLLEAGTRWISTIPSVRRGKDGSWEGRDGTHSRLGFARVLFNYANCLP